MIRELVRSATGYPGLFLFCAVSGLVVPLPEDFSLLFAGMRIAQGEWGWAPTLATALAGVLVRDLASFWFGRALGGWLLDGALVQRILGADKIDRARELVQERGAVAVLAGRFVIGFRAPMFMVAGSMGVAPSAFVWWDGVGLLVAVPVTVGLGFAFGEPMAELAWWLLQRTRVVVAVVAVIAAGAWLWRRRNSSGMSDL